MSILNTCQQNNEYDVVICGGGLAGQTLARQLKLTYPEITIAILEKGRFPLKGPVKVGESTIESSSHYLRDVLQLQDYLDEHHIQKFGLRYFWTDAQKCLSQQPEIGLSSYSSYRSYQLDRAALESHLCDLNRQNGVRVFENARLAEVYISKNEELHQIDYKDLVAHDGCHISARWVVDATGRKRFLQRKLNLLKKWDSTHSASWFWVEGSVDLTALVPKEQQDWHQRVPSQMRHHSTIHLMGDGYWVWLIPLSSNHTSIGIVAAETIHPFAQYNTRAKALRWLERHEPALYQHLHKFKMVDFLCMRDYSYTSQQIFSLDRWACIGDSALFPDPFYSPGIVLLSQQNSIVTELINLDRRNALTKQSLHHFNRVVISSNNAISLSTYSTYPYMGNPYIYSLRYIWDLTIGWGLAYPDLFNAIYLDPQKSSQFQRLILPYLGIINKVEKLLARWATMTNKRHTFSFIDYLAIPFLKELYARNTQKNLALSELMENYTYSLYKLEELAQTIFLMAVEDLMPEQLALFSEPIWVNARAISLDPERWRKEGLFRPKTEARDLSDMRQQIRGLYTTTS